MQRLYVYFDIKNKVFKTVVVYLEPVVIVNYRLVGPLPVRCNVVGDETASYCMMYKQLYQIVIVDCKSLVKRELATSSEREG